jgi:hypothetical protein
MPLADLPGGARPFGRLREFARRAPVESCDLCGTALNEHHDHLVEPGARRLLCACVPCALLFSGPTATKFQRVPRDARPLPDFRMSDAQWDELRIPINLAFFFRSSTQGRVIASYPSPAGATESLLPLDAWEAIEAANPELRELEEDVEALLVHRVGYARDLAPAEYFIVPIDQCFKLVGLIRSRWRGLSGGNEVWREIAHFFNDLKTRAVVRGRTNA